ncbi:MAG TPA: hypothetical protein VOA64_02435 [Candidatus Dormibacteraeota bacterium]|nr:hypothetical protein [Candidatus Dormibacteraeota bacterium]
MDTLEFIGSTSPRQGNSSLPHRSIAQRDRILALLRERGSAGVSNVELNAIAFHYGGRRFELRKAGFVIDTIRKGDSIFTFVLRAEPGKPFSSPTFEREAPLPLFAGAR